MIEKDKVGEFDHFVSELEKLKCVVNGKLRSIGIITGESPIPLSKIKIEGLIVEKDGVKKAI